jgi:hypothetical protein
MAVLQFSSSAYNYAITVTTAAAATTTTTRRCLRSNSCYPKVEMSIFIGLRMLTLMAPAVCVPPFRINVLLLVLVRNERVGLVAGHFGQLGTQNSENDDHLSTSVLFSHHWAATNQYGNTDTTSFNPGVQVSCRTTETVSC